ncbi:hypothetical protein M431DRAFT_514451 [Trichoderma harzianum CBS 226.95]|uniref:Uncharacterized protein n=1 Tax=Trichoderma harzianum CBS 226.95 TaxID=983964 RepID=A0A2T3ZR29_TRIHA|nr:hypothetical protein M431DRAFT_514451 [Trichoderma harzianum CBS 226.95]PTB47253.1 hypothetical protein M431DRAFT_514451 [Trichoderma harzianum CBS 226.95]
MSNRVEKPKSKSTEKRHSRAAFIRSFGFEVSPCFRCLGKRPCLAVEGGDSCAHCCYLGRSCDSSFVPMSSLDRITEELKRLERQEELAEEALIAQQKRHEELLAQQKAERDEALARLMRLRKLRRLLRARGVEMVNRGLNAEEMEEADRREEEERQAELARVSREEAQLLRDVQSMSGVEWSSLNADLAFAGLDPLASMGGASSSSS